MANLRGHIWTERGLWERLPATRMHFSLSFGAAHYRGLVGFSLSGVLFHFG